MIAARLIALGTGYLFGLFQTGYLYGKSQGIDIRKEGSGNAGATNSLRVLGLKAGLITFAGDLFKAIFAVLLMHLIFGNRYPEAVTVLTGCWPQAFPQEAEKLMEADIILGNSKRGELGSRIREYLAEKRRIVDVAPHQKDEPFEPMSVKGLSGHTRAFLKIEDGCERYCAYCIIPYARGRVRSKPLSDLRDEVEGLARRGYKEVVLTGINLPAYGQDLGLTLCDAVEAACSVEGIRRVRLGSLEPERLTPEVIARMRAQSKLCPQFHLSLQSGCDATLKRMNRRYTAGEYEEKCRLLRRYFDRPALTTDIIVGFPGETDEEFEQSKAFVDKMDFYETHIFKYSKRKGTKAADMPDQVPEEEKNERSAALLALNKQKQEAYERELIGTVREVLIEEEEEGADGLYGIGHTKEYVKIRQKLCQNRINQMVNVEIESHLQIMH